MTCHLINGFGICVDNLVASAESIRVALEQAPASKSELMDACVEQDVDYNGASKKDFDSVLYFPPYGNNCEATIFMNVLDEILPLDVSVYIDNQDSVYVLHRPKYLWEYPKTSVEYIHNEKDLADYFAEIISLLHVGDEEIPVKFYTIETPYSVDDFPCTEENEEFQEGPIEDYDVVNEDFSDDVPSMVVDQY